MDRMDQINCQHLKPVTKPDKLKIKIKKPATTNEHVNISVSHTNASIIGLPDDMLRELLTAYTNYNQILFNMQKSVAKLRRPNIPEGLSENIVLRILKRRGKNVNWCAKTGDLVETLNGITLKLEVKCFSSVGPTSFGPTCTWHKLYFLDARSLANIYDIEQIRIKCFEINLSNSSSQWKNIKVNSIDTYEVQCKQGRRPRIQFDQIKTQIGNDITEIYDGDIITLLSS